MRAALGIGSPPCCEPVAVPFVSSRRTRRAQPVGGPRLPPCRRVQLCPIREGNPWDPVVWVNPAQPPSVSRCAPRSRSPVCLIVLTRSCSCRWGPWVLLPPLAWCVRFIYLFECVVSVSWSVCVSVCRLRKRVVVLCPASTPHTALVSSLPSQIVLHLSSFYRYLTNSCLHPVRVGDG